MPDLTIRFKKKSDGSAALSCTRADGSITWQRQEGRLGVFFPLHDLTHLAVESVLGFQRAFYGLLAEGWDITAFAATDHRKDLPHEALFVELIVGYFDLERQSGNRPPADEFNDKARTFFADKEQPAPPVVITQTQIDEIRAVRDVYFAQWKALPAGDTLELSFDRAAGAATQTRPCVVG